MKSLIKNIAISFDKAEERGILRDFSDILSSGILTLGGYTKRFEEEFSKYIGTKYAVAVNGGTAALEICLRVLGLANKNILIPTNTFIATAWSILHSGNKVSFIDMPEQGPGIDFSSFKKRQSEGISALVLMHNGGFIQEETREIKEYCREKNILLLEDAAHAHGSSLFGQKAGSFGEIAAFSLFPTKVITSGEGGVLVTDNETAYKMALELRDQAKKLESGLGYNWRMSEFGAVVGYHTLKNIEQKIAKRNDLARCYAKNLTGCKHIEIFMPSDNQRVNFYKFIIKLDKTIDKKVLGLNLYKNHNVQLSGGVYDEPLHLHPYFRKQGYREGVFPHSEEFSNQHICLPLYCSLTRKQINIVSIALKEEMNNLKK